MGAGTPDMCVQTLGQGTCARVYVQSFGPAGGVCIGTLQAHQEAGVACPTATRSIVASACAVSACAVSACAMSACAVSAVSASMGLRALWIRVLCGSLCSVGLCVWVVCVGGEPQ